MITTTSNTISILRNRRYITLAIGFLFIASSCVSREPEETPFPSSVSDTTPVTTDTATSKTQGGPHDEADQPHRFEKFETTVYRLNASLKWNKATDSSRGLKTRIVGQGVLRVTSVPSEETHGANQYVSVSLEPLSSEVRRGSIVTLVPVDSALHPVNIRLNSVQRIRSCFEEITGIYEWNPESMLIPLSRYPDPGLEASREYRLVALYPPPPTINRQTSGPPHFPVEMSDRTLQMTLDFDGDNMSEAIKFSYCCDRTPASQNPAETDCTSCAAAYVRFTSQGSWTQTWFSGPC